LSPKIEKVQHVADDVLPAAVDEHGGKNVSPASRSQTQRTGGDQTEALDELRDLLAQADLIEKDQPVEGDHQGIDRRETG